MEQNLVHVGLYGTNGHQLALNLAARVRVVAGADYPTEDLNPPSFGVWGNDQLHVFGTERMVETVDGFRRHSLYLARDTDPETRSGGLPFPPDLVSPLYVEHYADWLLDGTPMPTPFAEEMAMTRAMLALHEAAVSGRCVRARYLDRGDAGP